MCEEGYTDKDCIKECGKGRFDCIYWQELKPDIPFVWGSVGRGKSTLVKRLAKKQGLKVHDFKIPKGWSDVGIIKLYELLKIRYLPLFIDVLQNNTYRKGVVVAVINLKE